MLKQTLSYLPYPPTSLPIRDLFLLDHVPVPREARVLEIGVGCGETTARLARMCREVVGVDIAEAVLKDLRYLEARHANLRLKAMDVTTAIQLDQSFDLIVSFDTLEHITDPAAYFAFVARHLRVGGVARILFPNETPATMHGITRFDSVSAIRAACGDSFSACRVQVAELTPWSRRVIFLAYGGMRLLRRRLRSGGGAAAGKDRPQRFDDTLFYRHIALWRRLSPLINLYWYLVLAVCRRGGAYRLRPPTEADFQSDRNLSIELTKAP